MKTHFSLYTIVINKYFFMPLCFIHFYTKFSPDNSSWCYTATICGRRDNTSLGTYCIKFDGIIDRRNPPLYSHTNVSQNPITTGDMSGASVDIPDLAPGSILRVNVTNPDTDTTDTKYICNLM